MSRVEDYREWQEEDRYSDDNLRVMCDYGVSRMKSSGVYDALRFDCFDKKEADTVKQYMSSEYPDIKFGCTYYNFDK